MAKRRLGTELHYVPNPSVEQPSLCDAILRWFFCFPSIQDAGEPFVDFSFAKLPEAFETQLHYLIGTHTSMLLTCSAGDEMLNLPQEADYNTTKLPHAIPSITQQHKLRGPTISLWPNVTCFNRKQLQAGSTGLVWQQLPWVR